MSKIQRQNSCGPDGPEPSTRFPPPSSTTLRPFPLPLLSRLAPQIPRAPLACAALAATSGILFAETHPPLWLPALFLLPLLRPWPIPFRPIAWILFTALLFATLHRIHDLPGERLAPFLAQTRSHSLPVRFSGTVQERLLKGGFRFHLSSLSQGATTQAVDNIVLLQVRTQRLQPGDQLSGHGRLFTIPKPRNPGERTVSRFTARIEVASFQQLERSGTSPLHRVEQFASRCRNWIAQAITRGIPPGSDSAGLIQAMVLGVSDETSHATEENFRRCGALHLFSVSGLHVAIFASVIWALLRPFPVSRFQTIAVIASAAAFYAFLTGLPASAVRATLMLSVVLFGFALRREARLLNSLGLAAILILAVDSEQLFDIGFQLSFSVMAAIALLCPVFEPAFRKLSATDPFIPRSLVSRQRRRWEHHAQTLTSLVSLSLAAWIGSLPLTLWYFGLLTPLSVFANCVLVPVSWLVMAAATLSLGLSLAQVPWLPSLINQANAACATLLQAIAAFFAQLPGAAVQLPPLSQALSGPPPAEPSLIVFDLQNSCAPQAIVLPKAPGQPPPPVWLIDPGDFAGYAQTVRPWLRQQQTRELEGLILTHGDSQHVDAAPACLKDFAVRRLIFSPLGGRSPVWKRLHSDPLSPRQIRLDLTTGSRLQLAPEAHLRILFPPPAHPNQSLADDECLVLLLEWHGWRFLSLADSGFTTEKWLLEHHPGLRCDVVIRSQHRKDPSGLPEFYQQLQPRCVISTNYGFPGTERIRDDFRARLASQGTRLFDQAKTGAVTLTPAMDRLTITPHCEEEPLVLLQNSPRLREN